MPESGVQLKPTCYIACEGVLPEAQAAVFAQEFLKCGPAVFVGRLKRVEINSDHARIVFFEQGSDHFSELRLFRRRRKFFDGAVLVVLNSEAVEEVTEELALRADQPDLQDVGCDVRILLAGESFANPHVTLGARFASKKTGRIFRCWQSVVSVACRRFGSFSARWVKRAAATGAGILAKISFVLYIVRRPQ